MFALHFGEFARMVAFAGGENENQTEERDERKRLKHARKD